MQRNLYLGASLLLLVSHAAFAVPASPYKAEATATVKPVGFQAQTVEFNIEAPGAQSLNSVTLNSGDLRAIQGKAVLTNALAPGKLNVKGRLLVNCAVDFEAVDASASSWRGLNTGNDPEGTQATLSGINSGTPAVSASHGIRVPAPAKAGNAAIDSREDGVSFTVTTPATEKLDRLFDWAESLLPKIGGSPTGILTGSANMQCIKEGAICKNFNGLSYRCYLAAQLCYAI